MPALTFPGRAGVVPLRTSVSFIVDKRKLCASDFGCLRAGARAGINCPHDQNAPFYCRAVGYGWRARDTFDDITGLGRACFRNSASLYRGGLPAHFGMNNRNIFRACWAQTCGRGVPGAQRAQRRLLSAPVCAATPGRLPGALEWLERFHNLGHPAGDCLLAPQQNIDVHLDELGILGGWRLPSRGRCCPARPTGGFFCAPPRLWQCHPRIAW